jgi:hypothetical protein
MGMVENDWEFSAGLALLFQPDDLGFELSLVGFTALAS